MTDIVRDIMDRLSSIMSENGSLTEQLLDRVEQDVRRDWGGDRPYINKTKTGKGEEHVLTERNRSIIRDWRAGERVEFIARRYRLSKRRVWQIIQG